MTVVNLLLNLKSMLESEFERLVLTSRNKEIERQPLKADSVILLSCFLNKPLKVIKF